MYPLTFNVYEWLELSYDDRTRVDGWIRQAGCATPERVRDFTHVPYQLIAHLYVFDEGKLLWNRREKEFQTQIRYYSPTVSFPLSEQTIRNAKVAYQQRLSQSDGKAQSVQSRS